MRIMQKKYGLQIRAISCIVP